MEIIMRVKFEDREIEGSVGKATKTFIVKTIKPAKDVTIPAETIERTATNLDIEKFPGEYAVYKKGSKKK